MKVADAGEEEWRGWSKGWSEEGSEEGRGGEGGSEGERGDGSRDKLLCLFITIPQY